MAIPLIGSHAKTKRLDELTDVAYFRPTAGRGRNALAE